MAQGYLSAAEAAARLGVKRATLYAYVSRGLLERAHSSDGRRSLFDPDEIDAFRSERRRSASGELNTVIASSITRIEARGHWYREVSALRLVETRQSFESVADLLWQCEHESTKWILNSELRHTLARVADALPVSTPALDRLRVSLSVTSALNTERAQEQPEAITRAGRTLIQAMCFGLGGRSPRQMPLAQRLWPGLVGGSRKASARLDEKRLRCLEAAMILLADHGLATSTFGVRVTASVRADPYSVVATGLGAMAGVLHGCAADASVRLFEYANRHGVDHALAGFTGANQRIPGFGHKIYKVKDPREKCLLALVYDAWAEDPRLPGIRTLRAAAKRLTPMPPNIDFALGAMAWLGGFRDSGTSIFAIARSAGWIAHAMEEFAEEPVRFRPRAQYIRQVV